MFVVDEIHLIFESDHKTNQPFMVSSFRFYSELFINASRISPFVHALKLKVAWYNVLLTKLLHWQKSYTVKGYAFERPYVYIYL